jgi:light-regulated signal transduction histidine kinase (bacteriophytochrome)
MMKPPPPKNEAERIAALKAYQVLDTDPEQAFDNLTRPAARVCATGCIELHALASKLRRSNEELSEFATIAAHDLQEPLRKLVSFSQLLKTDIGEELSDRAAEDLMYITDAAMRMQKLIGDLLDLSRVGTASLNYTLIPLDDCVRSALEALSLRIEESSADVIVDKLPMVNGDRRLLTQLFQNLIGNALKFVSDDKPRVHINCARGEGQTVIGVKDNGIGIEPQFAKKIFEPFKRVHERSRYDGTGIGLAIARKAVERHGGHIWVESKLGEGSHFRFTLAGLDEGPNSANTDG